MLQLYRLTTFLTVVFCYNISHVPHNSGNHASSVALGMASNDEGPSKRKRALKTLAKTAGIISTVAFTTAGLPPAALAAKKAKEVVEVVETVDQTQKLLAAGAGVIAAGAAVMKLTSSSGGGQDFLEFTPYYDHSDVKVNTFKNKAPFTGKVVSTKRIVGPKATGETCHIVIDHKGDFPVSIHGFMHTCMYSLYLVHDSTL